MVAITIVIVMHMPVIPMVKVKHTSHCVEKLLTLGLGKAVPTRAIHVVNVFAHAIVSEDVIKMLIPMVRHRISESRDIDLLLGPPSTANRAVEDVGHLRPLHLMNLLGEEEIVNIMGVCPRNEKTVLPANVRNGRAITDILILICLPLERHLLHQSVERSPNSDKVTRVIIIVMIAEQIDYTEPLVRNLLVHPI